MRKKIGIALLTLFLLAAVSSALFYIYGLDIAVLNPKGTIAIKQKGLLLNSTYLMLIVVIPVFIFMAVFAWRYREKNKGATYSPDWEHNYLAECFWWGIPCILILILAVWTWRSSHELDPYKKIETGKASLTIQVVALDWKWLFIYPEQGIATVNYLQFPEQTPLHFEITAEAPMNSFWIPQLGGQIYAMPAMTTKLNLIANEKGVFKGSNANISGTGFSGMKFDAVSTSEEDFDAWVQSVRGSSNQLTLTEYNRLLKPSVNEPVTLYVLRQDDLFHQILLKYEPPRK